MEILVWDGRPCGCRPECDSEKASAEIRCNTCGTVQTVRYGDEPPEGLEQWWGGTRPEEWCCHAYEDALFLDPADEATDTNRWLHALADRLDPPDHVDQMTEENHDPHT